MSDYKMRFCIGIEPEPVNVPVCIIFKCKERNIAQRMAVWLVADFEALSCQITTTFDTSCAARIPTAPAINYTAC